MSVPPGDMILSDEDGVVVVDAAEVEDILARAEAALEEERAQQGGTDASGAV